MLSKEDNDYLCRIGPGTAMGDFMRQYWLPAIRSDELPEPNCPPLRVKLLGEELIGFRLTSGQVGLIQNACPHRGASLFFGRNEEEGLRCVYHGWKFDATGQCVDMPSEPPESVFKTKVKATAYPTYERNGIIWAYMGPRAVPPPLPDIEATLLASGPRDISVIHRPCNWMQGWEGEMDTVHAAFLHGGATRLEDTKPGTYQHYHYKTRAPRFSVVDTDFGTSYGAYRPAEADTYYWRIAHMLFPFYAMIPTGEMGREAKIGAYVPMDDEHTLHWEIFIRPAPVPGAPTRQNRPENVNTTTGWHGRFNVEQTAENDYMIDRALQASGESFSGIPGVRQQDMAVTESMGPIYKRWQEHLGTTDQLIIRTRLKLMAAAKALAKDGSVPPGVDNPEVYRQRSGEIVLPRGVDWWEGTKEPRSRWVTDLATAEQAEQVKQLVARRG